MNTKKLVPLLLALLLSIAPSFAATEYISLSNPSGGDITGLVAIETGILGDTHLRIFSGTLPDLVEGGYEVILQNGETVKSIGTLQRNLFGIYELFYDPAAPGNYKEVIIQHRGQVVLTGTL